MTDLTASGRTDCLGFTRGEAGHVVVVHVSLACLGVDTVKHLCFGESTESRNRQYLSLTSCEESRAVCTGENVDLCGEGTDLVHASSVDTLFVTE